MIEYLRESLVILARKYETLTRHDFDGVLGDARAESERQEIYTFFFKLQRDGLINTDGRYLYTAIERISQEDFSDLSGALAVIE